jgi:hypothetical protein
MLFREEFFVPRGKAKECVKQDYAVFGFLGIGIPYKRGRQILCRGRPRIFSSFLRGNHRGAHLTV